MDNKFYNLMRVKDALDAEKKNLARLVEKQSKHIEILTNADKKLTALVVSSLTSCQLYNKLIQASHPPSQSVGVHNTL